MRLSSNAGGDASVCEADRRFLWELSLRQQARPALASPQRPKATCELRWLMIASIVVSL